MWYRIILVLVFTLGGNSLVQADEFHLILSGTAKHAQEGYNERNWGLGFEYDFQPRGRWIPFLTGARFLDSNEDWSNYMGGGIKRRLFGDMEEGLHLDAGVVGFLMTRETFRDNKPFPGALPFASIGNEWLAINITYVPKIDPKMVEFFYYQLMIRIAEF